MSQTPPRHWKVPKSKKAESRGLTPPGHYSLVDEINHKIVTDNGLSPTSSTILGPFWSPETPFRELGATVIQDLPPDGEVTFFHGVVKDVDTGRGIPGAVFDMWQASTNGKYDVFDPENQTRHNLRGKFKTNDKGEFWFYCLKPTEYAIDTSGPSAELLKVMGRHPHRPAHIHAMVSYALLPTPLSPPPPKKKERPRVPRARVTREWVS